MALVLFMDAPPMTRGYGFAKYNLEIISVIKPSDKNSTNPNEAYVGDGSLINSSFRWFQIG